ncbi:hypothetical protein N7536_009190 [Penicillium majusculum]|nr:hypothetical protein N7536_009190 [Penicillium majusculum]
MLYLDTTSTRTRGTVTSLSVDRLRTHSRLDLSPPKDNLEYPTSCKLLVEYLCAPPPSASVLTQPPMLTSPQIINFKPHHHSSALVLARII